jgi:ferritin-like metal-binding protein YciE
MKLNSLNELFELKLKALYDIETQLVKALPKVAKNATDPDLKKSLEDHLAETKVHAQRLEDIFSMLEMKIAKTKVEAIRGLIADTEWSLDQDAAPAAMDALIIASARYVEHYEMAGYMTAVAWANALGYTEAAELLSATLAEEEAAEETLRSAAEGSINERALEEGDTDEEDEDE